jgi:hypothetical protein
MSTKKRDSIPEERIQNVSAPRAEPGTANMTIPRRDLLTGAALVLVGSASGCGGGKQQSGAAPAPLRTQFMADFTAKFIGDPTKIKDPTFHPQQDHWPDPEPPTNPPSPSTRLWPRPGEGRNDIATDYATFANVLLTVVYVPGSSPAGPNAALAAEIVQFLQAQKWPNQTPIPPQYAKEDRGTVNLVEIAVIQDRLVQAINTFDLTGSGAGGGGSNWPPH